MISIFVVGFFSVHWLITGGPFLQVDSRPSCYRKLTTKSRWFWHFRGCLWFINVSQVGFYLPGMISKAPAFQNHGYSKSNCCPFEMAFGYWNKCKLDTFGFSFHLCVARKYWTIHLLTPNLDTHLFQRSPARSTRTPLVTGLIRRIVREIQQLSILEHDPVTAGIWGGC